MWAHTQTVTVPLVAAKCWAMCGSGRRVHLVPTPGFGADLYAEYSEPWFTDGRFVLRGGSWATRRRYLNNNTRNFFPPERNDIIAGFRTCAL